MDWPSRVLSEGHAVVPGVLSHPEARELAGELEGGARRTRGGRRDVLGEPAVRRVVGTPAVRGLVERVLGARAHAVRATLFDKRPGADWTLAPHQDVHVAVRERRDVAGFRAWTVKQGVTHAEAPREVLEGLIALRFQLDEDREGSGALRVVSGTHLSGKLSAEEVQRCRRERGETLLPVPLGGVLVCRPLLVHASSRVGRAARRRVLHVVHAAAPLPGGLEWAGVAR